VTQPTNRRNYYRLLHVQADAPAEVIKASYRALMALHHPDKGGDHTQAALVNEAYHVLSDSARRIAYDAQRAARASAKATSESFRDAASANGRTPAAAAPSPSSPRGGPAHRCPLCLLAAPAVINATTRCTRCRAPLAPVVHTDKKRVTERRAMPRVSKSDWALLYVDWPSEVIDVRMRDLSLDGISVFSGAELPVHRTIRVVGAAFDVVADIVSCRRVGKVFTLHAQLVTAYFTAPAGGFVSTSA
jgi:hypothetical protein